MHGLEQADRARRDDLRVLERSEGKRSARDSSAHSTTPSTLWSHLAPLRWPYLAPYACVVGFCFVAFQHVDLSVTVTATLAYLRGHFADFYDFNAGVFQSELNYLPSIYVLYTLFALPIKAWKVLSHQGDIFPTGKVLFYFKAVNALFYVGTGLLMRSIGQSMGLSNSRSDFMAVVWMTAPLAVFSQFIFGQYDILTVFFYVWALDFYLKGKLWRFSLLTAVALSFKYFPLFSFAPLLLVVEKRPLRVLLHSCLAVSLVLGESMLYRGSKAFQAGVLGFSAAKRVMLLDVDMGGQQYNLTFFLWSAVCVAAFFRERGDQTAAEARRDGPAFGLLGLAVVFVTIVLHPQWLIHIVPFLTIVAVTQQSVRYFALDTAMMALFCITTVMTFPGNVDEMLWSGGVFSAFNPDIRDVVARFHMGDLLPSSVRAKVCLSALYAGIVAYPIVALMRGRPQPEGLEAVTSEEVRGLWWRGYGGLACWLVPALVAFFLTRFGIGGR